MLKSVRLRFGVLFVVLAAIAGVVAGCGDDGESTDPSSTTGTGSGGATTTAEPAVVDRDATLTFAAVSQPTVWDPVQHANPTSSAIFFPLVYDQLLELDANLEPKGMLAEGFEVSTDGLTTTFKLRDDAKFWDGTPLDAVAVKANLDRAKSAPKSTLATSLANVASVAAPDATTVVVQFATPDFIFPLRVAADPRLTSIVNPNAFNEPSLVTNPQGSGPYRLVSASGDKVVYERVEDHWDATSGLAARLEYSVITDATTRLNAFRTDQVMMSAVLAEQAPEYESVATESSPYQLIKFEQNGSVTVLFLNYTRAPLNDPLVREAIDLAIDREALVQLANGYARPTQQLFANVSDGWLADADSESALQRDVEGAKKLLAEAGLPGGFPMSMTFSNMPSSQLQGQVIQQNLKDIGIDVTLAPETQANFTTAYAAGTYDSMLSIGSTSFDPGLALAANLNPARGFGIPDYIKADAAGAAMLPIGAARTKAYEAISQKLVDTPAHIPLRSDFISIAASKKVVGLDSMAYARLSPALLDVRRLGVASEG